VVSRSIPGFSNAKVKFVQKEAVQIELENQFKTNQIVGSVFKSFLYNDSLCYYIEVIIHFHKLTFIPNYYNIQLCFFSFYHNSSIIWNFDGRLDQLSAKLEWPSDTEDRNSLIVACTLTTDTGDFRQKAAQWVKRKVTAI
jgi:hypothetical protein